MPQVFLEYNSTVCHFSLIGVDKARSCDRLVGMKKLLVLLILIGNILVASEIIKEEKVLPITVYVVRNGDSDRSIHKIFLTEKSAKKYCDAFKENHNYDYEALALTE